MYSFVESTFVLSHFSSEDAVYNPFDDVSQANPTASGAVVLREIIEVRSRLRSLPPLYVGPLFDPRLLIPSTVIPFVSNSNFDEQTAVWFSLGVLYLTASTLDLADERKEEQLLCEVCVLCVDALFLKVPQSSICVCCKK